MWQYTQTDELYHYGVPGMKWGVRRAVRRSRREEQRYLKKADKTRNETKKNKLLSKANEHRKDIEDLESGKATPSEIKKRMKQRVSTGEKVAKGVLATVGVASVVGLAAKLSKEINDLDSVISNAASELENLRI